MASRKSKSKNSTRRSKRSPKKRSVKGKVPRRGKHSTKKSYGCVNLSHLKKYRSSSRKSPSYPANECGGLTKRGNDGTLYLTSRRSCTSGGKSRLRFSYIR